MIPAGRGKDAKGRPVPLSARGADKIFSRWLPGLGVKGLGLEDLDGVLAKLDLDRTVPPVSHRFQGGTSEAKRLLRKFLTEHLPEWELPPATQA